jgi:hypothetical protein
MRRPHPSKLKNLKRYVIGFFIGILYVVVLVYAPSTITSFISEDVELPPDGALTPSTLASFTDEFKRDASAYWSTELEYAACVEMRTVFLPEEEDEQIQLVFHDFKSVMVGGEDRVTLPSCTEKAVIHSHPSVGCRDRLWSGDIPSAESWYRAGGVAYLIQCDADRIEVYTRDTGTNGVVITI